MVKFFVITFTTVIVLKTIFSLMHIWNVQVLHAMNMHQSSKKMMVLFRSNSIFKLD